MAAAPPLSALLLRGARGRCPRCGKGRLFAGLLRVADACPACRLGLTEHDAGDGPAVAATFVLGVAVAPLAAFVELAAAPPLWLHVALWGPLVIGGTPLFLRPLKGAAVALQYRYRSLEQPTPPGGA